MRRSNELFFEIYTRSIWQLNFRPHVICFKEIIEDHRSTCIGLDYKVELEPKLFQKGIAKPHQPHYLVKRFQWSECAPLLVHFHGLPSNQYLLTGLVLLHLWELSVMQQFVVLWHTFHSFNSENLLSNLIDLAIFIKHTLSDVLLGNLTGPFLPHITLSTLLHLCTSKGLTYFHQVIITVSAKRCTFELCNIQHHMCTFLHACLTD